MTAPTVLVRDQQQSGAVIVIAWLGAGFTADNAHSIEDADVLMLGSAGDRALR